MGNFGSCIPAKYTHTYIKHGIVEIMYLPEFICVMPNYKYLANSLNCIPTELTVFSKQQCFGDIKCIVTIHLYCRNTVVCKRTINEKTEVENSLYHRQTYTVYETSYANVVIIVITSLSISYISGDHNLALYGCKTYTHRDGIWSQCHSANHCEGEL